MVVSVNDLLLDWLIANNGDTLRHVFLARMANKLNSSLNLCTKNNGDLRMSLKNNY